MDYALHRAVFARDAAAVEMAWGMGASPAGAELDPHGNSALHCAVLLGADEVVSQLLELGFPSDLENAHGWTPLNEAIALGNREIVKIIYSFQKKHIIQVAQKSRKALQESFLRCPNFRMELSWKFTSMLLGPLLRRYAPSDVYTIWKCGERIRVDGTLRAADGIFDEEEEGAEEGLVDNDLDEPDKSGENLADEREDDELGGDHDDADDDGASDYSDESEEAGSATLWKRGSFSVLYNTESEEMILLDRVKETALRIKGPAEIIQEQASGQDSSSEEKLEEQIDSLFDSYRQDDLDYQEPDGHRPQLTKEAIRVKDSTLTEANNWRGLPIVEQVDGWSCKRYNFNCVLKTSQQTRGSQVMALPATMTFEQYLAADLSKPLQPSKPDVPGDGGGGTLDSLELPDEDITSKVLLKSEERMAIEEEHKAIQVQEERRGSSKVRSWTKKMRGRVWMAEKFPLATSDLVPLLQILRCVNKRFEKVALAVEQWSDKERFPIQFRLPLMYTIGILIKVSNVSLITKDAEMVSSDTLDSRRSQLSWWGKTFGTYASTASSLHAPYISVDDELFAIPSHYQHSVSHLKL